MSLLEEFKTLSESFRKIVDDNDVESLYIHLDEGGTLNGLEICYIIYKEAFNKKDTGDEYSIVSFLFLRDLAAKYPGQISFVYSKDGKKSSIFNLFTFMNQNFEQALIDYTSSKWYENSAKIPYGYIDNVAVASFITSNFTHKDFIGIHRFNVILYWLNNIITVNLNLVREVINECDDFYDVFTNDICGFIYSGFLTQYTKIQDFTIMDSTIKIFGHIVYLINKKTLNKPNSKGYTPIMKTVESKNYYMFEKLAEMGLDITIKNGKKSVCFYIDKFPMDNLKNIIVNKDGITRILKKYYPDYKYINL